MYPNKTESCYQPVFMRQVTATALWVLGHLGGGWEGYLKKGGRVTCLPSEVGGGVVHAGLAHHRHDSSTL